MWAIPGGRGAGLVRVLIGSHPWRWARGIVQGEAGMSTWRASGEWRHRKVAERRSLWAALVSAAKAKPQRRTVHTLVVWAAKMSIAGGGGQGVNPEGPGEARAWRACQPGWWMHCPRRAGYCEGEAAAARWSKAFISLSECEGFTIQSCLVNRTHLLILK